jgi:phosphatidyl-myo-inositol dimannoside synthase
MLICPSFFDGRRDGIGRVSGAFFDAFHSRYAHAPFVISANEAQSTSCALSSRCFGRKYGRLLAFAASRGAGYSAKNRPILCMHLGLSPAALLHSLRSGNPYAVFLHGVECWHPLRLRSRIGVTGATLLFFNSNHTRTTFLKFNPWAVKLAHRVIPLGVPLSVLNQPNSSKSTICSDATLRVLCVGRMSKADYYEGFRDGKDLYKGFKQLIQAVGQAAQAGLSIRLEIVGDGDARPELEAWLAARPEASLVTLLGRVSDERLAQAYDENDVFCLPSEGEGFGLVFAEAMAHGLPCVCVNAGAAPEVVTDQVTGLVARPRDVDDLAAKFILLGRDTALRARLGAAARQRVVDFFAYDKFLARIDAGLCELERSRNH